MIQRLAVFLFPILLLAACKSSEEISNKSGDPIISLTEKEYRQFEIAFMDGNKEKILGNLSEAEAYFRTAIEINPKSDATLFELAKLSVERGKLSEASNFMEEARSIDPKNFWYAEYLAQIYAESGRLESAIGVVEEIIEEHPDKYDYYFNLASLLSAQGKYDEALKVYEWVAVLPSCW